MMGFPRSKEELKDESEFGNRHPTMEDKLKYKLRVSNEVIAELLAEFLGTFILISFGDGSVAQSVLTHGAGGSFLTINICWGLAVAMGVWSCGGVSGAHLNPAVTLTFCILGRLPWYKLPTYMIGQYMGAFTAAACVYGVYYDALNAYDGGVRQVVGENGTAGIWSTYPRDYLSVQSGLGDQIFGTALLLICIMAITDKDNMTPPKGLVPLAVGLSVMAIGMAFGINCGYAINPARDWGPRLFTLLAGWGKGPFSFRNYTWFIVPFIGPHLGAIIGAMMYLILVGNQLPKHVRRGPELVPTADSAI